MSVSHLCALYGSRTMRSLFGVSSVRAREHVFQYMSASPINTLAGSLHWRYFLYILLYYYASGRVLLVSTQVVSSTVNGIIVRINCN